MSSTPTLGDAGLEPRRTVLRAFAVARNQSYTVMPGGLATVVSGAEASGDRPEVSISKDIWVLASEPERMTGFWLQTGPAVKPGDPGSSIPSRVAENLFWLGRYAERAEGVARLLRVVYDRRNDFPGNANPAGTSCLSVLLVALTAVTTTWPGFADGVGADQRERPGAELYQLVVDSARPGTLAHAIHHLLDAAYGVRDQLSNDTWLAVGALDREIFDLRGPLHEPQADVQGVLQRVVQSLLALSGLINESMVRDPGWQFLDAGRRFERAIQLLRLLQATLTETRGTASDSLLFESVLTAAESIITYRRRYRSQAQLETVLDLLLLDADNPRSVAFQLDRLNDNLATLPNATSERLGDEQRFVLEASTAVRIADNASMARQAPTVGWRASTGSSARSSTCSPWAPTRSNAATSTTSARSGPWWRHRTPTASARRRSTRSEGDGHHLPGRAQDPLHLHQAGESELRAALRAAPGQRGPDLCVGPGGG